MAGSVLKAFNSVTSQWEAILVGKQGIQGPQGDDGIEISATAPTNTGILWADTTEPGDEVIPPGGGTGDVLAKVSSNDYDSDWVSRSTLAGDTAFTSAFADIDTVPTGGATGQVLVKSSGSDYDTAWDDDNQPSPIGTTAKYLASTGTTDTGLMLADVLTGSVIFLPTGTIEEVGAVVTVAGSAGSVVRLGVYSISGFNGVLVWDAGTIDGASATVQTITGGTVAIKRGWYALVAVSQGSPATRPTVRRNTGLSPFTWNAQLSAGGALAFGYTNMVQAFSISGALPATISFSTDDSRRGTRLVVKGTWV